MVTITNDDKILLRKIFRHHTDKQFDELTRVVQHIVDADESVILYDQEELLYILADVLEYLANLANKPFVQQYIRKIYLKKDNPTNNTCITYYQCYNCIYVGITMWQINDGNIVKLPVRDDATYLTAGPALKLIHYE